MSSLFEEQAKICLISKKKVFKIRARLGGLVLQRPPSKCLNKNKGSVCWEAVWSINHSHRAEMQSKVFGDDRRAQTCFSFSAPPLRRDGESWHCRPAL